MAGGGFVDGAGSRAAQYEYRITWYFIFACIIGSMGGSLFGYDLGVSGEFSDCFSLFRSSSFFMDSPWFLHIVKASSNFAAGCFEVFVWTVSWYFLVWLFHDNCYKKSIIIPMGVKAPLALQVQVLFGKEFLFQMEKIVKNYRWFRYFNFNHGSLK